MDVALGMKSNQPYTNPCGCMCMAVSASPCIATSTNGKVICSHPYRLGKVIRSHPCNRGFGPCRAREPEAMSYGREHRSATMEGSCRKECWAPLLTNRVACGVWCFPLFRTAITPMVSNNNECVDGREHGSTTMKHHGVQHTMHVQMGGSPAPLP
jgi:hypothetical protein